MLIGYTPGCNGLNPNFFRKEDVRMISKLDPVRVIEDDGLTTKLLSPAARVTTVDCYYTYLLYDPTSRASFLGVLKEFLEFYVALQSFPDAFIEESDSELWQTDQAYRTY